MNGVLAIACVLVGAGVGGTVGSVVGFLSEPPSDMPGFGFLIGGLIGAGLGGVTGAFVAGTVVG